MATLNVSLGDLVDTAGISEAQQEVIVARSSLLGEAVSRLIAGQGDIARARDDLELIWQASRMARLAVAAAAENGADVVAAAVAAVDQALALADDRRHLNRAEVAQAAAQSAVVEAALISDGAARRVEDALEARRLEQPPD